MNARSRWTAAACAALAVAAAGCKAPQATLDLITVARKGLAGAQEAEAQHRAAAAERFAAQAGSLDAAFDADVRLAAAGEIQGPDGKPTGLTAEWVISARKGYAAARDLIGNEARAAELASLARTDNLKAADEALDRAAELILQQAELTGRARQTLLDFHRRLSHGE